MSVKGVTPIENTLEINWQGDQKSIYHNIWLRDNCHCSECYYPITKQRLLNSATIDINIKPKSVNVKEGKVEIVWDTDHSSTYDVDWLRIHSYNPRLIPLDKKLKDDDDVLKQKLWQVKDIKDDLPQVDYNKIMQSSDETDNEEAIKEWLLQIHKFGFSLINNVPISPTDTEKLCEKLNYIRPTHYGGFWDFTADLSKNDTAYTNFDISNHTDGTYWSNSPGLQLFHLLYHDGKGGTTSLVDSFKCAEILKAKYPESYEIFCKIPVPAHSAGEPKVCIQPDIPQPIFKLDHQGKLIQVRWNQSDRSTMDYWENPEDVIKFYKAIKNWVEIITSPENELWYQMKPGQCLIFDNWRIFHSRSEFTGQRRLCGAYFERDDFISRLKLLTLGREAVLDSI
ncbi:uncharacterized protein KGF55_005758 [Candida pseudojiufengensis]|uniref:uncharacterized protein n=1 Tax=Candida pseudojiufengensis TaxID=497109 RepID=UPI0022256E30|nr:uncharacterized protein KGF55_005758 [Candida pseudojiufengensis]KAI5958498.1 hypothetical protein KGF55_005758 [Candida pseudojiufengensis]